MTYCNQASIASSQMQMLSRRRHGTASRLHGRLACPGGRPLLVAYIGAKNGRFTCICQRLSDQLHSAVKENEVLLSRSDSSGYSDSYSQPQRGVLQHTASGPVRLGLRAHILLTRTGVWPMHPNMQQMLSVLFLYKGSFLDGDG